MGRLNRLVASLDQVTKFYLSVFVALATYLATATLYALALGLPFNRAIMNFSGDKYFFVNLWALLSGLFAALAFSVATSRELARMVTAAKFEAASADERAVLHEVRQAQALTQDSLRFRLAWSKAKTSQIVSQLDKKGLLVRARTGKTYALYLPKTFTELVMQRKDGLGTNAQ